MRRIILHKLFSVVALTVMAMLIIALPAGAQDVNTGISPMPLKQALSVFAQQRELQIIYASEVAKDVKTRGAKAGLSPRATLDALLAGTGLKYEFINDDTVTISIAPAPTKRDSKPESSTPSPVEEKAEQLQSVTVTGTRIRGAEVASPTIVIGIEDIRAEGFVDLGQVIRSMPQNFAGGQNPGVKNASAKTSSNYNYTGGSGLNLRGLGPDASLTLLNGKRMSYGGSYQSVDISAVPVDAIDRVEVVTDGGSAIYGSDAVGGVANVVLKRDYDGFVVSTQQGKATSGGKSTSEYTATGGVSWMDGGFIAVYRDSSSDPVFSDQRPYTDQIDSPSTIYPGTKIESMVLSGHQALGESIELQLDALHTQTKSRDYFSYLPEYYISDSKNTNELVSPSLHFALPSDWSLSLISSFGKDEGYGSEEMHNIETGEIEYWGSDNCNCNDTRAYEVGAEGPVFSTGAGTARLAVGTGYRKNTFESAGGIKGAEDNYFLYGELNVPLSGTISPDSNLAKFALTAALRSEDYRSFGSVTTPKLGLVYNPTSSATLKGTWGQSFKAPTLYQRYWDHYGYVFPVELMGGVGYDTDAVAIIVDGGNADLKPEKANTWTASFLFHPDSLPGLEAEITLFNIDYTDRVTQPLNHTSQALSNPIYTPYIDPWPGAQQQADLIAALGDNFYDFSGGLYNPDNVVALFWNQYTNVVSQKIRGVDLSGSYRISMGGSNLTFRGTLSWLDTHQKNSSGEDDFPLSGTIFNPPKVKTRLGGVWNMGDLGASLFVNYVGGVRDDLTFGTSTDGASFTTVDLAANYRLATAHRMAPDFDFGLSVQNLFNRRPPEYSARYSDYVPYDSTNYSALGRFVNLSVAMRW